MQNACECEMHMDLKSEACCDRVGPDRVLGTPPECSSHVHSASVLEQMAVICFLHSKGLACKHMLSLMSCMSPCSMRVSSPFSYMVCPQTHPLLQIGLIGSDSSLTRLTAAHCLCPCLVARTSTHQHFINWLCPTLITQTPTHQQRKFSGQIDDCSAPKS